MAGGTILLGDDGGILMDLAIGLRSASHTVTVAQSERPVARAVELAAERPDAMVVMLDGSESAADVRCLFAHSLETRFVFVVPEMPPRAPLARVVREYGGVILSRSDAPVVVVATVVALLADTRAAGHPSSAA